MMKIAVIGTGYVGLVSGACLATLGHKVTCVDKDQGKIDRLNEGKLPIYETGLEEIVDRMMDCNVLSFSSYLGESIQGCDAVFICVGTPAKDSGGTDLTALWEVVEEIKDVPQKLTATRIIIIKSTVPVGTNAKVSAFLNEFASYIVVSNPEFLREGSAVKDFLYPDRIVMGVRCSHDRLLMGRIYKPLPAHIPLVEMSPESAEMTKYTANAFLATKISFINEMACICELLGADIDEVRKGIGHDERIGFKFFQPGPGYGGSCFPKDVASLIHQAGGHISSCNPSVLLAVETRNAHQKCEMIAKLVELFPKGNDIEGRTIAVWGLAFKAGTDDIRESPATALLIQLLQRGAKVRVYDPQATLPNDSFTKVFESSSKEFAADAADALVIATEWDEFKRADLIELKRLMRTPIIVDGRNLFNPAKMAELGFTYASIGRATVYPKQETQ